MDVQSYKLFNEDCFETFARIPDGFVDMVLCDPPYGTTACSWDSVIPLEPMWVELKRIIKPNGAIVMTASQPFTTVLGNSGIEWLRYSWVWYKRFAGNFVQAERMPLKVCEDVLVFCFEKCCPKYNPQMTKRKEHIRSGGNTQNPGKAIPIRGKLKSKLGKVYTHKFPNTLLVYSSRGNKQLHPTQKPVALMEYMVKTYTNKGDVVLDFAMGSGTTGAACGHLHRRFIGCDNDVQHGYFKVAKRRIFRSYNVGLHTMMG